MRYSLLLPLLSSVACAEPFTDFVARDPGPTGTCAAASTALGADDETPAGYTAGEVLAGVTGERATVLKYDHGGAVTDLTLEVAHADGEMRWIDETWEPESGTDALPEADPCGDRLEIDATLRFVTADGAFDERIPVVIVGHTAGVGRIDVQVAYGDLVGSYSPTEIDPAEWDDVALAWAVNLSAHDVAGEIALIANRTGEEADGTAYDEGFASDMARFPEP